MPKKPTKKAVEKKKPSKTQTRNAVGLGKATARNAVGLGKASAKTNVVVKIDQRKTTTARKPSAPQQRNAPSTVVIQGSAPQSFYPVYQPSAPALSGPVMTAEMVKSIAREVFPGEAHKIGIKPALTKNNLESAAHFSIYPDWETVSSLSDARQSGGLSAFEPTFSWKSNSEYPEESSYNLSVPISSSRSTLTGVMSSGQSVPTWAKLPSAPSSKAPSVVSSKAPSVASSKAPSVVSSKAPSVAQDQAKGSDFTGTAFAVASSKAPSVASAAAAPAVVLPEEEPKKLPIIPTGNKITIKTPAKRPPIKIGPEIPDDEVSVYSSASSARQRAEEDLAQRQATEAMIISKKEAYFDGLNEEELTRYGRANGMSPIDAQKKLKKRLNDRGIKATDSDFAKREASLDILQRAEKKSGMR